MSTKIYLYPIWIRAWHWANAILCLLLILTGISMHYSQPGTGVIRFDLAVAIHNVTGVILSVSYIFYILGNLLTGNGKKFYRFEFKGYGNKLWRQARYYAYGFFKKEEAPFPINKDRKFNPLQQISYVVIMYIAMPLVVITGWGMFFPETIIEEYLGISGFLLTDIIHLATGFSVSVFLLIHLYFATLGEKTWSHYKSIVTGYHEH